MKYIVISILVFSFSVSSAQNITYNYIIDDSPETKEVMKLFESYVTSKPEKQLKNSYWNTEDQLKYEKFDFLESEFEPSLYMGFPIHVLSIKSVNNMYQIKAQFSYCQDTGVPYVLAIVNYYMKKEGGSIKLFNALSIGKKNWICKSVGLIDFYYPPYHDFNQDKAIQLNKFANEFCKNFEVEPIPFDYYLANEYDEIQKLKGIDYYIGMGGKSIPTGKSAEGKVFCSGLGEYYPHEVFHVLVNKEFPNMHFWVSEGIATFLGGSRGEKLEWHMKRTNEYLSRHLEINLNDLLDLKNLDHITSYHYVLGGLIAKKIYDKGSWSYLKKFISSVDNDDDYYKAIKAFLGVERSDLDSYIRNQLKSYAYD